MTITIKTVVAVLSDLMFTVKIQDAVRRAGWEAVFVQSPADALARAKNGPGAIVLDLNYAAGAPLETISALKADEGTRGVPLIGFVSHVQVDLRKAAEERGCDVVVARSVFARELPRLLGILPNELSGKGIIATDENG